MKEQNSQEGIEESSDGTQQGNNEGQGGYMRSLHKLEEKLYSPDLNLSGNAMKAILYIRHNSIRWDIELAALSYKQIADATGIDRRNLIKIIKDLVKRKILRVVKVSDSGEHSKNRIGLNREYFGDLIEITGKPVLSVIEGGKTYQLEKKSGQVTTKPVVKSPPGQWSGDHHERGLKPLPEPQPRPLKNLLKEPSKITKQQTVDLKGLSWEKARERLLKDYPNHSRRLDAAYAQLTRDGVYPPTGLEVERPAGFLLKSWHFANLTYAYADQVALKEKEEDLPDHADPQAIARIRAMIEMKGMV